MYYKIPDASGIFANNIIKIKNFCFEFKELNSRLFYGNFLSNQYNGRLKSPAKMGQKKEGGICPPQQKVIRRRP